MCPDGASHGGERRVVDDGDAEFDRPVDGRIADGTVGIGVDLGRADECDDIEVIDETGQR